MAHTDLPKLRPWQHAAKRSGSARTSRREARELDRDYAESLRKKRPARTTAKSAAKPAAKSAAKAKPAKTTTKLGPMAAWRAKRDKQRASFTGVRGTGDKVPASFGSTDVSKWKALSPSRKALYRQVQKANDRLAASRR